MSFVDTYPDWETSGALCKWERFAQDSFGEVHLKLPHLTTNQHIVDSVKEPIEMKKRLKSNIVLEIDQDGLPVLPDQDPTSRVDIEAVV